MRRFLKRAAIGLVLAIVVCLIAGVLVLRSDWLREKLRGVAVTQASKLLTGQLTIGKLSGSLFHDVTFDDVTLTQADGTLFHAPRVRVDYDWNQLAHRQWLFADIVVDQPVIRIAQNADGWNVGHILKPRAPASAGAAALAFAIAHLRVNQGDVTIQSAGAAPRRLSAVSVDSRIVRSGGVVAIDIANGALHDEASGYDVRALTGRLENGIEKVDLRFAADNGVGRLGGRVQTGGVDGASRLSADVDLTKVNLQDFIQDPKWRSDITAHALVQADLRGPIRDAAMTFRVTGTHASAFGYEGTNLDATGRLAGMQLTFNASANGYGGTATTKAVWQVADEPGAPRSFSGQGIFRRVSLPALPKSLALPPLASQLAGQYRVHYDATGWFANVLLDESIVEDATVAPGTVGSISQHDGTTIYSAAGYLDGMDLRRLSGPLNLPSLAADRYRGLLTGHFSVAGREGCRDCAVTRLIDASADVPTGTFADASLTDLSGAMSLVGSRLVVLAHGHVDHLTPETVGVASPVPFDLNGDVDGQYVMNDVHADVTLDNLQADAVANLVASTIGGVKFEEGHLDAAIAGGILTLRETAATGLGLHATATGQVALGETGTSAFDVVADADDVRTIADWAGQPVTGAAHLEAHVTGPHDQPQATGRLSLHQISYGTDASALTVNSDLTATMPNWTPADATVTIKSDATFLKIKGTDINSLTGQASYHNQEIVLDATAKDQVRELRVGGRMTLAPADRAVYMRTLSLTTAGQTWTLPAGQEAVLKGDATRLDLRGLTLTNGPQRVTVEGAYALKAEAAIAADTVHVTAKDVQIADVDRLLLGTRNVKGLLQGDVTLTGTIDDPTADGTVTVTGGAVEGTAFESLHATARLERHDLTLDATLVQSGTVQIKAAGHVPFGAGSLSSTRPMDIAITSPPIDLGFAQLLTTAISKVVGTGELNLRLTGSPEAPVVDGTVKIAGGGFVLEGSGVSYKNVTGSLAFAANHLTIDSLTLQDDDGHELRATGQADVLGDASKRAFNVKMTANKVHVLHNDMGTLQMVGDVLLTGDFEHPQISGHLRLDSGRLEVDKILQKTTNTAYSDTPQSGVITDAPPPLPGNPAAEPGGAPKPPPPPRKSGFDRVDLNLTVDVPDNLVMRGRGLRVGTSTVGLGDMNVIAGGTIEVKKPADGSLDVIGDVEVIRGTYTFQGRRFDVQRGSAVRFRGGSPTDPALDVSGDRDVGNITATVHVHGTAKNPQVNLTSQPPLDEAEILSLVVFGQSLNDLGQGQRDSLAQTAGAMAAGTIANPLADSVARALDLDVFEILAPSQGGSAPVLSLGSTIGSRVYVGVKHEIGGDAAAVSFEYRFARFLRLVTSFAQGALQAHALERPEAAGIDLLFVFRY